MDLHFGKIGSAKVTLRLCLFVPLIVMMACGEEWP